MFSLGGLWDNPKYNFLTEVTKMCSEYSQGQCTGILQHSFFMANFFAISFLKLKMTYVYMNSI